MASTQINLTVAAKNGINVTNYTKLFNVANMAGLVTDTSAYLNGSTLFSYVEADAPYEYADQYCVTNTLSDITAMISDTSEVALAKSITNAQLRTGGTPVEITTAASGTGYVYLPDIDSMLFEYTYATGAFTGNYDIVITDGTNILATAAAAISGSASKTTRFVYTAGVVLSNIKLYLATSASATLGNPTFSNAAGTGTLRLVYKPVVMGL